MSKINPRQVASGTHTRLGINKTNTTGAVVAASYTTYATVTATSLGGECEADFRFVFGNGNSGANRTILCKVQLDGVDVTPAGMNLDAVLISGGTSRFNASFLVSSTPSAASHTWTLQLQASTGSAVILDQVVMKVTEITP